MDMNFEWDENKEKENVEKHGVDFDTAQLAFEDENALIIFDEKHSKKEPRYFVIGEVEGKILTVRFTVRENVIRIFGAGYWRKEKIYYERENKSGR
jgi:uncharacterized DUF497 family protein